MLEATWLKDGKPLSLKDKKKYHVSVDGTTHTLVIPKSEEEDSAEFTCTINGAKTQGKVTVEGKISVKPVKYLTSSATMQTVACTLSTYKYMS